MKYTEAEQIENRRVNKDRKDNGRVFIEDVSLESELSK